MPDSSHPVENPAQAFEKLRAAMKQVLTVSKPEIVRREAEDRERRKGKREHGRESQSSS